MTTHPLWRPGVVIVHIGWQILQVERYATYCLPESAVFPPHILYIEILTWACDLQSPNSEYVFFPNFLGTFL